MRPAPASRPIALPAAPVLVTGIAHAVWLTAEGEVEELGLRAAAERARHEAPLLVHAPATARRLNVGRFPAFDLLELFAFVRPAQFCLPTPRGIIGAVCLQHITDHAAEAMALRDATVALLTELTEYDPAAAREALAIARTMARGGWRWGPAVLAVLGDAPESFTRAPGNGGLKVWDRLAEWSEHAPDTPPGNVPVEPVEARHRLAELTGVNAEARPQQADYASAASYAFAPREQEDAPRTVLAEAGTGVGKTLGYLAPATLWAEKNLAPVWISTYTRNLQHQIDRELDRLCPTPEEKARRVVIRKGRENYLCLLNFEEAAGGLVARPQDSVPLGLMARWAGKTRDGDMVGGDFPAWLADLGGRNRTRGLADRRGECIYSACAHYHKCFIEKSIRRARRADIVIANHALVMAQAALASHGFGGIDDTRLPTRYVFDEGHHVFDAADSAFSALLSGSEAHELRRWILGPEGTARSRARGLKSRAGDLVAEDETATKLLEQALIAARALPGDAWLPRIAGNNPIGPTEAFLAIVRRQVYARSQGADDPYGIETDTRPPLPGLVDAADSLERALARLAEPMVALAKRLAARLEDEAQKLDTNTRSRIEAVSRALRRRGEAMLGAWRSMLKMLATEQAADATPPEVVDWFAVERIEGKDLDIGMHRHFVDPAKAFAASVAQPAHGVLVTSATLTDGTGDLEADWLAAATRTGARHLPNPVRASVPSPFDYPKQTRILVVRDVARDNLEQAAAAYRELFLASGGGGLGLFTAISRLKGVYRFLAPALERSGLPLYAQHIDALDTGTLVDIFRAEEDSCLLGTDAVRDGVDVPGRSLRLIVFDRVPWPRPDILHRARKAAFGGTAYDDMLTRLRLKQAFGRLVRRAGDTGVFVMLDSRLPTRLCGAFPPGVEIQRLGLAEAIQITREFLRAARP